MAMIMTMRSTGMWRLVYHMPYRAQGARPPYFRVFRECAVFHTFVTPPKGGMTNGGGGTQTA